MRIIYLFLFCTSFYFHIITAIIKCMKFCNRLKWICADSNQNQLGSKLEINTSSCNNCITTTLTLKGTFLSRGMYYFAHQIIVISKMIWELSQKSSGLWGKTFFINFNALCSLKTKWNQSKSLIVIGGLREKNSITVCTLGLLLRMVSWSNTIWIKPQLYFTFPIKDRLASDINEPTNPFRPLVITVNCL